VRGLESDRLVATLKHFAGYSASLAGAQPRAGVDGAAHAARRDAVPFEMAIREGGAARS
jgi:beta-glucosidase-like glycosyl hydrolase